MLLNGTTAIHGGSDAVDALRCAKVSGAVHYTYDEEGNLLTEEQSDYYLKRYQYAGFNRMEVSDIINYTDNTHVITDYRYDSFGRRTHTVERMKWGMRTIYDGLSFEVVKEGETTPDSRGITTTGTEVTIQGAPATTISPSGNTNCARERAAKPCPTVRRECAPTCTSTVNVLR